VGRTPTRWPTSYCAPAAPGHLEAALAGLAELRAGLPEIDGVALAREARRELEERDA
jgi:hypothetical protein